MKLRAQSFFGTNKFEQSESRIDLRLCEGKIIKEGKFDNDKKGYEKYKKIISIYSLILTKKEEVLRDVKLFIRIESQKLAYHGRSPIK